MKKEVNRILDFYRILATGLDKNLPTQKSMDLGLMVTRESVRQIPGHEPKLQKTTRITGKGQTYFINKFLKEYFKKPSD